MELDGRTAFRMRLARVPWETEQHFQAMNEWRAVLETEPDNVEARIRLGLAHVKEGDRMAAFLQFQRVLKVEPDNPVARQEFARLTGQVRR